MVTLQRWAARAILTLTFALAPVIAMAQTLVRDAEIEYALQQVAQPILQAAGLPSSTRIFVILDSSLNAFVVDNKSIFFHSGLLLKLDTPAKVQAVIAHEAAHIANGHISRRRSNIGAASTAAQLGLLLAAAAAAAGGSGYAAAGLAIGAGSAAQRALFAHTRAEEASADQAALRYMRQAGVDPKAMVDVLDIFRGQEALSRGRQDPYAVTHPLTRDRLRAVEAFAAGTSGDVRTDPTTAYWYARAVGKLSAFTRAPSWTLRRVRNDTGEIATMRRAVAYHRKPDTSRALETIDQVIGMRPNDPFYHELKGQILLESRRVDAAIASYRRAIALRPREPLILRGLGRALLGADTASSNAQALQVLTEARGRDAFDPGLLRDLALAHARAGQNGLASVATAERYAILRRFKDAATHAQRAAGLLPQGSSGWLRAQDVLSAAKQAGVASK